MGLKLIFFSPSLGFFAALVLPSSFYLLEMAGDFAGMPILLGLTGVEFSWELGLTILVLTGVEALAMLSRGFTSCADFIWVGGWIFDGKFLLKSI